MAQSIQSTATEHFEAVNEETGVRMGFSQYDVNEIVARSRKRLQFATTCPNEVEEVTNTEHRSLRGSNNADRFSLVKFPLSNTRAPRMATLHPLQEWEGHVVEIEKSEFVARLVDLTAGQWHESEKAVIPLAEISEYDASRIVIGSIFRWVIGYERSPEGTRKRVSQFVFRDLPRVTGADLRQG